MRITITSDNPQDLEPVCEMLRGMVKDGAELSIESSAQSGHTDAELRAAAVAVRRGDYGNGAERIRRLKEAGYTDKEIKIIQSYV